MGKARVHGQHAQLIILSQSLLTPIFLGELDSFDAKSRTSLIMSRPIGYINEKATHKYGGWDLSFSGGKVNWELAHFYWLHDNKLRQGDLPPNFAVWEVINHFNGAVEHYLYKNVSIAGLDLSRKAGEELTESFEAFAPVRTLGNADTTILHDPIGNAMREAVFRAKVGSKLLDDERIL